MPDALQLPDDDDDIDGPIQTGSHNYLRRFGDIPTTRYNIFHSVKHAVAAMPPLTGQKHALALQDVDYTTPDHFSLAEQKKAILSNKTLTRRLSGTWVLKDKATDQVLDQRRMTIAHVPYLTDRGTFINNGNEYTLSNQLRLRPGIFSRRKANGELEAHVNVMPGQGVSHHYYLDPASNVFRLRLGQARIPLWPLLKTMGVTPNQLREAWGPELAAANIKQDAPHHLDKLFEKLARPGASKEHKAQAILEAMQQMRLDPQVTQRTLGQPISQVDPDAILATTKKLLSIHRNEADPDDRDHLANQILVGPEDMFSERIRRAHSVLRPYFWRATSRGSVQPMPPGALTKLLQATLLESGLGTALEEVNPAETLDYQHRVTRMGEGGIGSTDAIPDESRAVQPSHLNFVDIVATPESDRVGVESRIGYQVRKGTDGQLYGRFRDPNSGQLNWVSPQDASSKIVAFPGELRRPGKLAYALVHGKIKPVLKSQVELEVPGLLGSFGPLSNMVPMKSASAAQRVSMGARMLAQALPLRGAEAPFVQNRMPGKHDVSFEERYGQHMGAVLSNVEGRVESVTPDAIVVTGPKGKQTFELYNNQPQNRKTFLHNTAQVRPGDMVKPGQLLATSNFTDSKGHTALGLNARVAFLPYGGANYEDAVVVSQAFAKRMSSEHAYQHQLDLNDDTQLGRNKYQSIFPGKLTKQQLANYDEQGIIKPGTKVQHGEPLILAVRQRPQMGPKLGRRQNAFGDASVLWSHHAEGEVTDIAETKDGPLVVVKSTQPMQVADKMCYDEQTEVLTRLGWKKVAAVTLEDEVCCLVDGNIVYQYPTALHSYEHGGRMYHVETQQLDLFVTDNHSLYVQRRGRNKAFSLEKPTAIFGKQVAHKKDGNWVGSSPEKVTLPGMLVKAGQGGRGQRRLPDLVLDTDTFMLLLGAFLSDGYLLNQPESGTYGIGLCQHAAKKKAVLGPALEKCGIRYLVTDGGNRVQIYSKPLMQYFSQFGKATKKYIPQDVFSFSKESLSVLFTWLMWGDGHTDFGRPINYSTSSPQLADDVQRLCLHIGKAANVKLRREAGVYPVNGGMHYCQAAYSVAIINSKLTPEVNHSHVKKQTAQKELWVEDYQGSVYCVTVPGHVLYVRRNGKPVWCGNSGLHGNKGVVAQIVPDDEMPTDAKGQPYEVLLNPLGVISRGNPAQVYSALLGKVAAVTGKPYKVPDFDSQEAYHDFVDRELRAHGLSDLDEVVDPKTGQKTPGVLAGNLFLMKLHHTAESKGQGRSFEGYTAEGTPAKGGEHGSKRVGVLELQALLSHGAYGAVRDASLVRGQHNPDYWAQFISGNTPAEPQVPFVYQKFVNQLKGAGVNVVRQGTKTHIMALTGRDIDQLAGGREITSPETVDWKTLRPLKGGLFDESLTGGLGGNRWAYIKLHEPMPNPVMEEPIRRVLGLTEEKFLDVLAGKEQLNGHSGPQAIHQALDKVDVPRAIATARAQLAMGKKSQRDMAVRKLKYLESAQRMGLHPRDWMLDKVPVLPPAFRPVSVMGSTGQPLISDANFLYREVFEGNQNLKALSGQVDDLSDERLAVYKAFKAVTGLGDPVQAQNQERKVKGLLKEVFGSSPKFGSVQRKLLGSTVDLVGRAVISPNPDLDMDQVGLPEERAWTVYRPFVVRRLVRRGMQRLQALEMFENRDQRAREALLEEMKERPVIINRAPVLHRYGVMAFWPQLTKNHSMEISPIVTKGFGADFDGDAMQYHVPATDDAKRDAIEKMMPSKNLYSVSDFKPHYLPQMEYLGGLWEATARKGKQRPRVFATKRDAMAAYQRGELNPDQPIEIVQQS